MVIEIKTDKPYEVIVEDGVLDHAGEKIAPLVRPGSRAMIVSETNVFPIYGERLKASLEKAGSGRYGWLRGGNVPARH